MAKLTGLVPSAWRKGTCPDRHTRAALPDHRASLERRTAHRNAGSAPELAASSQPGRQNPYAYLLRRRPGISALRAAAGSLRQDADHPRQGIGIDGGVHVRSEEHTSELQSLMRISYAV